MVVRALNTGRYSENCQVTILNESSECEMSFNGSTFAMIQETRVHQSRDVWEMPAIAVTE
jgi:hypothetical protein